MAGRLLRLSAAAATMAANDAGVERGPADQRAVDVGLGQQRARVVGLDAAAVQDAHAGRPASAPTLGRPAARIAAWTSCASVGLAVLPVPMAQTGS